MNAILGVMAESSVRAVTIAAAVALILWAMRVKSAAIRHRAWTGVLLTMLFLPMLLVWAPRIAIPILPAQSGFPEIRAQSPEERSVLSPAAIVQSAPSTMLPTGNVGKRSASSVSPIEIAGMLYLAGFGLCIVRLMVGMLLSYRLARKPKRDDRGFYYSRCAVPLTMGLLHPRILLPLESREWNGDKLDAVLIHEREHVRRRDPLVEWLAILNRSIYWFHPLAWWLCRKLTMLAEQACDEAVLANGHDRAAYAELLLDLARSLKKERSLFMAWSSSIHGSTLSVRIRKILTAGFNPALSPLRLILVATLCSTAVFLPTVCVLAHVQTDPPRDESQNKSSIDKIRPAEIIYRGAETASSIAITGSLTNEDNAGNPAQAENPLPNSPSDSSAASDAADPQKNYKKWLEEGVTYIISEEEANVLRQLKDDADQEKLLEQFWANRNTNSASSPFTFMEEYYHRIAYANEHFASSVPGSRTDRGRIYILYGKPDELESHPSGGSYRQSGGDGKLETGVPYEIWRYRNIAGIGQDIEIQFADPSGTGEYHMVRNPNDQPYSAPTPDFPPEKEK